MKYYQQFRKAGHDAKSALQNAKIYEQWLILEDETVRLRALPEEESYFDVYGKPDGYVNQFGRRVSAEQERKEICETIERDGCWCVFSEYFDGEKWQYADSVGMCTGYNNPISPFQNWYVPDLMQAAIEAAENCRAEACLI